MNLEIAARDDYKNIRRLYKSAFPKEERAPFFLLKRKVSRGNADVLIAGEHGEFMGFVYVVCYKDLVYLFYFAVDDKCRGRGFGSNILRLLKEKYGGKRIFLAREQLDENADNYGQRIKRHEFYLRNGFKDLPCHIREGNVIYDVMGIGGNVTSNEYDELITAWGGKMVKKMICMELT